jgi:hypothetical protein
MHGSSTNNPGHCQENQQRCEATATTSAELGDPCATAQVNRLEVTSQNNTGTTKSAARLPNLPPPPTPNHSELL